MALWNLIFIVGGATFRVLRLGSVIFGGLQKTNRSDRRVGSCSLETGMLDKTLDDNEDP
jgi:hypothetical protein